MIEEGMSRLNIPQSCVVVDASILMLSKLNAAIGVDSRAGERGGVWSVLLPSLRQILHHGINTSSDRPVNGGFEKDRAVRGCFCLA